MRRKIAAILAADIVGYSRLVAEDEEDTLRRLMSDRGFFKEIIARFGGRIFNTGGDSMLAEFESAVEAARCAVELQEGSRDRNQSYAQNRRMEIRIGMTVGDIVEQDGDLFGDGVNIAARLEGLAPPGGIFVSNSFYEQVASKLALEFVDRGKRSLKNMPQPVQVYELYPRSAVVAMPTSGAHVRSAIVRGVSAATSRVNGRRLGIAVAGVCLAAAVGAGIATWRSLPPSPPTPAGVPAAVPVPAAAPAAGPMKPALPPSLPRLPDPVTPAPKMPQSAPALPPPPLASPPSTSGPTPSVTAPPPAVEPVLPSIAPSSTVREPRKQPLALPDRKRTSVRCGEILERAQLGELSPEDREILQTQCR